MRNLHVFVGSTKPEYSKPFTLVDPQGDPWTIATDEVWLFAVKGLNKGPRFRGGSEALSTILKLLRCESRNAVKFERQTLREASSELGSILGVTVDLKRFATLVQEFPERPVTIWNITEDLGEAGLMLACSDCLAVLMGCDGDLSDVPVYDLDPIVGSPLDVFMLD